MAEEKLTPEVWFHRLGTKYVVAQICFHLNQIGVFNYLHDHGSASLHEISEKMKLNETVLGSLLNYLVAVDDILQINSDQKFEFSEFGKAVLARYQRGKDENIKFNILDLRVGAYGPVWAALGDLTTGKAAYGVDVKRDGRYAEEGIYKLSPKLMPVISECLGEIKPEAAIELGANTGLSELLCEKNKSIQFSVLDRSQKSIDEAAERFKSTKTSGELGWICADVFNPEEWLSKVGKKENLAFFTIHFHEFITKTDKLNKLISYLRANTKNSYFIAVEQPRVPLSEKSKMSESLWLNAQSHVLIHHLNGYGKILTMQEWNEFFQKNGCRHVFSKPTNFLGFEISVFQI
jgi:hypothetical protein